MSKLRRSAGVRVGYMRILLGGLAVVAGAVVLVSTAASAPRENREASSRQALADELGLVLHRKTATIYSTPAGLMMDGVILEDCSPVDSDDVGTIVEIEEDAFYCVYADSEIEAWIIGRRLQGHEPTDAEIEAAERAFADFPPPPEE